MAGHEGRAEGDEGEAGARHDVAPLAASYAEARLAFLGAAAAAGARVERHVHPLAGPDGGELAVDVAELGPPDAPQVALVVSGTHGVEGFAGSALQRHWLEHHPHERPDGVGLIFVHGLNPYGFAWVRRVNEDNVDLNRNFVDWHQGPPATPDYDRLAELLVPVEWTDAEQQRTTGALLELAGEYGLSRLQAIISGGQYSQPLGVFSGGAGPVWSHRWLRAWSAERLAAVERLAVIDLHTGLGPWGHGELIGHEPGDSEGHRRAATWWGDVRSMADGTSVSAQLSGDWLGTVNQLAPTAEVTAAALEFGTVDPVTVLQAVRADAWLHAYSDPIGLAAQAIRAQVRAAFADDDPAWLATLWPRFADVLGRALTELAVRARRRHDRR